MIQQSTEINYIAYIREIASRTEQYFCPIKHLKKNLDPHHRLSHFFEFGDEVNYQKGRDSLREKLDGKSNYLNI